MDIKLLTEVEKAEHRRAPAAPGALPPPVRRRDGRAHRGGEGDARRPRRHPRPSLSARRGHQVRRLHRRLAEARARRGQPRQGRVHRLLRRALHGRERRHPARAAPESRPAGSRRRLLDGRHGRARSARDLLARAERDGRRHRAVRRPRRRDPGHLHQLVGGDQSVRRRARRHRLHVDERRGGDDVGVGARREAADAARPASRPQHRATRWACRSTRWSCGIPNEIVRRARRRSRSKQREADPVEGALLGPHALHRAADRRVPQAVSRRARSSRTPSARSTSCRRPTRAARPSTSSRRVRDSPAGSVWAVATEVHLVNRLAHEVAPDRTVVTLDPFGCLCSTMFRVSPNHLLWILEGLVDGKVHNQIVVPERAEALAPGSRSIGCSADLNLIAQHTLKESSMAHAVPPLPYDYNALEPHIDEQTMQIHHDKHHAAYVNNLNAALEKHPELQQKSIEDLLAGHQHACPRTSAPRCATTAAATPTTRCSGRSWARARAARRPARSATRSSRRFGSFDSVQGAVRQGRRRRASAAAGRG